MPAYSRSLAASAQIAAVALIAARARAQSVHFKAAPNPMYGHLAIGPGAVWVMAGGRMGTYTQPTATPLLVYSRGATYQHTLTQAGCVIHTEVTIK